MDINKLSAEQMEKIPMIDLASKILAEEKKELNFLELFDKIADYKKFTKAQKEDLLARFYTDLNVDGRFTTLGSNLWGLKRWYPVDQTSEKSLAETRKRDLEDEELLDEDALLAENEGIEEVEDEIDLYEEGMDELDYDAVENE